MLPWRGVDRSSLWAYSALLAVCCSAALCFALTRPSMPSGIHDSDSALYIVEAISLDQTSPWDAQPEWNTLVRVAALPWGGLHVVLLKIGLWLCGPSPESCEFRAGCLYRFWSAVAVASIFLAAVLGHLLRGRWGAVMACGFVAASVPHVRMYTQFNQLGTAALFSLLLLTAGAWRALCPGRVASAIVLGLVGFLYPFADNMAPLMWLAFPAYLWLVLPVPDRRVFARALAPYAIGTSLAIAGMVCLIGLRWATRATVYDCTLIHLLGRVPALVTRPTHSPLGGGPGTVTFRTAASLLGTGGVLAVGMAALYAAASVRRRRDLCLAPVALAYTVSLLLVPPDATVFGEYLQHGLQLVLLATGVIAARLWSEAGPDAKWILPGRMACVACLVLMLVSARGAARSASRAAAGETWAALGGRLATLPVDTVIASTIEEEVGILYSGRRILTQNDTGAADLARIFEAWPGRIDYLVIRPSEENLFSDVVARRGLRRVEIATDAAGDEWDVFGLPAEGPGGGSPGTSRADASCWRQPYIPYSFDAGWRYAPGSILGTWGPTGLLLGDPRLWIEWSHATRLPYARFAETTRVTRPPSRPAAPGSP